MERLPPWLRTGSNPLCFFYTLISHVYPEHFLVVARANLSKIIIKIGRTDSILYSFQYLRNLAS